jgi:hypothetical protein
MGGGGGNSNQVQRQEVTQTNIPSYARPYFERMMQQGNALLTRPYATYEQERIAGFTPEQKAVQQGIAGLTGPAQFGQASDMARDVASQSMAAGQYTPGQFNAQTVTPQQLQAFQLANPQMFGAQQAQQYMSPFVQEALAPQMREAINSAQRAQVMQNLGAARSGSYGGSRQLLAGMERERNLQQSLGDIQARGMQAAYENAQQQFERDRAAQMGAGRTNLEAQLGVQSLSAQQSLQAALENQRQNLEAQRLGEQSQQFGADLGLRGLAQSGSMAQLLGQLGTAEQQATLARLGAQQQSAAQQQALNQQYLTQHYNDFLQERDYPLEMLQQYSGLLRGMNVQPNSVTATYAPSPGLGQQILGTGLQAASIYNMGRG